MASLPLGAPSLLAVLNASTAAHQLPSTALHHHAMVFALNLFMNRLVHQRP